MALPDMTPPAAIDWNAVMARHAAFEAKSAALVPVNKAALFAVLAAADVSSVLVHFDGGGDSGQIESVQAFAGDAPVELPTSDVLLTRALADGVETRSDPTPIADAIETLAFDLLTATHAGWENNDGAYGEFRFDVAAGTITLDHNDRYVAVESYEHAW